MLPKIAVVCGAAFAVMTLAGSPAGHAGSLCDDLAAQIRAGEVNPTARGNGAITIERLAVRPDSPVELDDSDNVNITDFPDLLTSDLQAFHPTPELTKAVKSFAGGKLWQGRGWWDLTFHKLGSSGAGVITALPESQCYYAMFFATRDGQAQEIAPPPGMTFGGGDACADTGLWIGSFGDNPAIFMETDQTGKSETVVAPWRGDRWGKLCKIDAVFQKTLEAVGGTCLETVDCNHMRDAALSIGHRLLREHPVWLKHPKGGGGDLQAAPGVPASIMALVHKLPRKHALEVVSFGSDSGISWDENGAYVYLTKVDGASDVVVVWQATVGGDVKPGYLEVVSQFEIGGAGSAFGARGL